MAKAVHLIRHQKCHRSAVQKVSPTVTLRILGRVFCTVSLRYQTYQHSATTQKVSQVSSQKQIDHHAHGGWSTLLPLTWNTSADEYPIDTGKVRVPGCGTLQHVLRDSAHANWCSLYMKALLCMMLFCFSTYTFACDVTSMHVDTWYFNA